MYELARILEIPEHHREALATVVQNPKPVPKGERGLSIVQQKCDEIAVDKFRVGRLAYFLQLLRAN